MYNVKITNNYFMDIAVNSHSSGNVKANGGTFSVKNLGSMVLSIPGIGEAVSIDIGDKKLPGYPEPSETWGMLLRFSTQEVYYRYEGQGSIEITFDKFGSMTFHAVHGSAIIISLPEFTLA